MTKLLFLNENQKKFVYRVQEQENIFDIANRYNTTASLLISENFLTKPPNVNSFIVVDCKNKPRYEVQPSDSVASIARRFNTTGERLLELNGIDYLFPFQIILIG